jgi:hypothetical protein
MCVCACMCGYALAVMGFELRASCLLARCSTNWATTPASERYLKFFCLFYLVFNHSLYISNIFFLLKKIRLLSLNHHHHLEFFLNAFFFKGPFLRFMVTTPMSGLKQKELTLFNKMIGGRVGVFWHLEYIFS